MSARRAIGWAVGLLLTISFSTSGNVLAQTPLTPAAGADAGQPGTTVHEPSAPPLYDQTAHVGSNWSDSSDYGKSHGQLYGYLSNQAADDFVVPSSVFWKVVTATVDGQYVGVQGAGVDHLVVQIYANSGSNVPGNQLYSNTFAAASIINFATGTYGVVFNPPVTLGPGHYWLSAQALEQCTASNCKHWVWLESTVLANSESAWLQPTPAVGYNCPTWKPRVSSCHEPGSSSGPDLLFKLEGSSIPVRSQVFLPVVRR